MEIKEYQKIVKLTAIYPKEIGLSYCTLGLAGETGEVCEKVKKLYRDKQGVMSEEFKTELAKELGDIVWYITAIAEETGLNLEDILQLNYNKLLKRKADNKIQGSGDNR